MHPVDRRLTRHAALDAVTMFLPKFVHQAIAIATVSDAVGAKLPAAVTAASGRAERITRAVRSLTDGPSLVDAVINAVDAGSDPEADPDVVRVLTTQQLAVSGIAEAVDKVIGRELGGILRDHAAEIVKAWASPFDASAAVLVRTHERIGDVELDDTEQIMRRGGDIATVWTEAQIAADAINQIERGWIVLAQLTGFAAVEPRHRVLRIADVTAQQLRTVQLNRSGDVSAWDLVREGLSLSLADGSEYRRRVDALANGLVSAA